MTKQNTWIDGLEASIELQIRPSRVAQIMRCGLLPFQLTAGTSLIHQKDVRVFCETFPELLHYFRCELEVDKQVESGELIFEELNFPTEKTCKLLKCVEAREPTFPMSAQARRKVSCSSDFSP
jgi:hypothetical protein